MKLWTAQGLCSNRARRNMAGKLIIVCGLPGSGKTTHAAALERSLGGVRFCADEWMAALQMNLWDDAARANAEKLQWSLCQRLLALGQTVIVEWGTWGRSERDTLRNTARALGATAELHYLTEPIDILFGRIQRRAMEEPPITREWLEGWAERIEAPTEEEAALYDQFWCNKPEQLQIPPE